MERTYKTQMEAAKMGIVTPEMKIVAQIKAVNKEHCKPENKSVIKLERTQGYKNRQPCRNAHHNDSENKNTYRYITPFIKVIELLIAEFVFAVLYAHEIEISDQLLKFLIDLIKAHIRKIINGNTIFLGAQIKRRSASFADPPAVILISTFITSNHGVPPFHALLSCPAYILA